MAILTTTDQGLNFTGGSAFIKTGTSTVISLTTSSDVGIGTTTPSEKLHVDGTGQFGDYLKIGTYVNAGYYQDSLNGAYRANGTSGNRGYYFQTNAGASTKMYIGLAGAYAGNVGIGTGSPAHKLTINAANNTTALGIDFPSAHFDFSANSTSGYTTSFHMDNTGLDIGHSSSSRSLNLKTGGVDRLVIKGGGNVGIGTTSPQQKLHVYESNAPAGIEIQGGLTTITAVGDVHSFIDFGTNDISASGGIAGRIESLSETSNGAHNGLAFYTGQQSRTPYLQKAMQIRNTGAISFGSGSTTYGSSGQILKSNGDAPPTWVAASTVIGGPYLTSETVTSLALTSGSLVYTDEDGTANSISLAAYLDEDSRSIASGSLNSSTGVVTFTRDDSTTFTLDLGDLLDDTNLVTSVAGKSGVVSLVKGDVG